VGKKADTTSNVCPIKHGKMFKDVLLDPKVLCASNWVDKCKDFYFVLKILISFSDLQISMLHDAIMLELS
jgi:hypothetical protein